MDFIDKCREKAEKLSAEQLADCQTHHIVPRHHYKNHALNWETFDAAENRVKLSFEDHVKAHQLRYEVYQEPYQEPYQEYGDKFAVTRMLELTKEGMRAMQQAGGQAVNLRWKREGRLMYDREFQKQMGQRSMARPDALEIRSRGGRVGNLRRHRNVTVREEDKYLWCWNGEPFLCTFGFDNGGELCKALFEAKETRLARVSPLIQGFRKSAYGWSCQKIEDQKENPIDPS